MIVAASACDEAAVTCSLNNKPTTSPNWLGSGMPVEEAVALAARCGAMVLTSRGPYGRQLTAADAQSD